MQKELQWWLERVIFAYIACSEVAVDSQKKMVLLEICIVLQIAEIQIARHQMC